MSRAHQLAGEMRWWGCSDRTAATAPARLAFRRKLEATVDPEGRLLAAERDQQIADARRAHYQRISLERWRRQRAP